MGSENLHDRINEAVCQIRAIDTHVHIEVEKPVAASIWNVLSYHNYTKELVAAGMPAEILTSTAPDEERLPDLAKCYPRSSTSMHAWMVRKLLAGLYEWDQPVTPENVCELARRAAERSKAKGWERSVAKKCGIVRTVATVDWKHIPAEYDKTLYTLMTVVWSNADEELKFVKSIEADTGVPISGLKSLEEGISKLADAWKSAGMCAIRVVIENDPPFSMPEQGDAERSLAKYLKRQANAGELRMVRDFMLNAICREAGERGLVVQSYVGVRAVGGLPFPVFPPDHANGLFQLIANNPKTKFDMATVSPELLNQFTVMAKHLPNLHLLGMWWFVQFPSVMHRFYRLRLEALPVSKWSAMFTDAYSVEWQYGKSVLIRKELAKALTSYVEDGYVDEGQAINVAKNVLYDSPARLYGIKG